MKNQSKTYNLRNQDSVFQNYERGRVQYIAKSIEGGIPWISFTGDRYGARDRYELSFPTIEEHEKYS